MAWPEDPVLILARRFLKSHGNLDAQKHGVYATKVLTEEEREEDCLARDLDVVRRARLRDVREHLRRRWKKLSVCSTLLRRKLTPATIVAWETEFGAAWRWLPGRGKEPYVPGDAVLGSRHEWPREPFLCKASACYLCGADFDSKGDLLHHWRGHHLQPPYDTMLDDRRVEEAMRQRIFHGEAFDGPYEVRGQEMRRSVGVHASHQTQSVPGTGSVGHKTAVDIAKPRG